eukprot:2639332-Amphidinium_carterae.1
MPMLSSLRHHLFLHARSKPSEVLLRMNAKLTGAMVLKFQRECVELNALVWVLVRAVVTLEVKLCNKGFA